MCCVMQGGVCGHCNKPPQGLPAPRAVRVGQQHSRVCKQSKSARRRRVYCLLRAGMCVLQDLLRDSDSVWELKLAPSDYFGAWTLHAPSFTACMGPWPVCEGAAGQRRGERNLGSEARNLPQAPLTALQLLYWDPGLCKYVITLILDGALWHRHHSFVDKLRRCQFLGSSQPLSD